MSAPDTIYTFTFYSATPNGNITQTHGDVYHGWVIADTGSYAVNQVIMGHMLPTQEYDGVYVITGGTNYGYDLGDYYGAWHEDGMTYVTHYFDGSTNSYVNIARTADMNIAAGLPYGTNYIGSEHGWFNSTGNFGLGSTTYATDAALT